VPNGTFLIHVSLGKIFIARGVAHFGDAQWPHGTRMHQITASLEKENNIKNVFVRQFQKYWAVGK